MQALGRSTRYARSVLILRADRQGSSAGARKNWTRTCQRMIIGLTAGREHKFDGSVATASGGPESIPPGLRFGMYRCQTRIAAIATSCGMTVQLRAIARQVNTSIRCSMNLRFGNRQTYADAERHLMRMCDEIDIGFEDWRSVRIVCAACSRGSLEQHRPANETQERRKELWLRCYVSRGSRSGAAFVGRRRRGKKLFRTAPTVILRPGENGARSARSSWAGKTKVRQRSAFAVIQNRQAGFP
jgi:hypothetical protein